MSNLPLGSQIDRNAPWMDEISPQKEVEVEVEITYVRKVKVLVNKHYEDGDLKEAVMTQVFLPLDYVDHLRHVSPEINEIVEEIKLQEEMKNWRDKDIEINTI